MVAITERPAGTAQSTGHSKAPRLRRFLKALGQRAASGLGFGLSQLLGSRAGTSFGILTYHRVTPWSGGGRAPTWNVTPQRLRRQLEGLLRRGYRPLPLRRLLAGQ